VTLTVIFDVEIIRKYIILKTINQGKCMKTTAFNFDRAEFLKLWSEVVVERNP
jgi:hypothetical protein